jgi:hypothetical protein
VGARWACDNRARKLRDRAQDLEREIESLEAAIARLTGCTADPETAKDGERMREIATERRSRRTSSTRASPGV